MSKKRNRQNRQNQPVQHFELRNVLPLTANQEATFEAYNAGKNLMLHGYAGTGKSYISLWLALNEILNSNTTREKIQIIRSVVPSRDMGFLPGSMKDKQRVYEKPYQQICDDLFGRGDGYEILKMKGIVDFESTSFLRGCTLNRAIVIVDEAQNLEPHEINTIMTRIGEHSRVVVCGDFRQTDLIRKHTQTGIYELLATTKRMRSFRHVEFLMNDCVRSGIVREYLMARESLAL